MSTLHYYVLTKDRCLRKKERKKKSLEKKIQKLLRLPNSPKTRSHQILQGLPIFACYKFCVSIYAKRCTANQSLKGKGGKSQSAQESLQWGRFPARICSEGWFMHLHFRFGNVTAGWSQTQGQPMFGASVCCLASNQDHLMQLCGAAARCILLLLTSRSIKRQKHKDRQAERRGRI